MAGQEFVAVLRRDAVGIAALDARTSTDASEEG